MNTNESPQQPIDAKVEEPSSVNESIHRQAGQLTVTLLSLSPAKEDRFEVFSRHIEKAILTVTKGLRDRLEQAEKQLTQRDAEIEKLLATQSQLTQAEQENLSLQAAVVEMREALKHLEYSLDKLYCPACEYHRDNPDKHCPTCYLHKALSQSSGQPLLDELAKAKKDTERLDWLNKHFITIKGDCVGAPVTLDNERYAYPKLTNLKSFREAIDAAILNSTKETKC